MAGMKVNDATGTTRTIEADGAGSDASPFRMIRKVKVAGPAWTVLDGPIVNVADASAAPVDLSGLPAVSKKFIIDYVYISVAAAMVVTIKEETSGTVLFVVNFAAAGKEEIRPPNGLMLSTANKKVQVQTSGAGAIFARCSGHSEGD